MRIRIQKYLLFILNAALILVGLISSIGILSTAFSAYRSCKNGSDDTSAWSANLADLRADLPTDEKIIGYLTDSDVPGDTFDPIDHDEDFVMIQYALAPFIIEHGTERAYVIGNFTRSNVSISRVEELFHLELIKDFSMGIYLFRRAEP